MPYGVGAPRRRATRAIAGITLIVSGLAALTVPAGAQAAPTGTINIVKQVEGGADVTAFFTVIGDPDVFNVQATTVGGQGAAPPIAGLPLGSYVVREDGTDGPFQLTSIECDDPDADIDVQGQQAIITLTAQAPNVTCTFTNTLAGAAILAQKVVSGNTTSLDAPGAVPHQLPRAPARARHRAAGRPWRSGHLHDRAGLHPPGNVHDQRDRHRQRRARVRHDADDQPWRAIASGSTSLTFTANVGDDLVLRVTNLFLADVPGQPGQDPPGATTTIAGGSTTTTTAATTTTATTVPARRDDHRSWRRGHNGAGRRRHDGAERRGHDGAGQRRRRRPPRASCRQRAERRVVWSCSRSRRWPAACSSSPAPAVPLRCASTNPAPSRCLRRRGLEVEPSGQLADQRVDRHADLFGGVAVADRDGAVFE